jgi:hypothetical protein
VATGTALAAFDQAVAATATSLAVAAAASDPVADPMPSALLLLGGLAAIAAFGAGIFLIVRSLIRPKRPGPPASTAG